MRILNLLTYGGVGGIERLCENIGKYSNYDNVFCFLRGKGAIYDEMKRLNLNVQDCSLGGKFSLGKWKLLKTLAKDCDIIVTHHFDFFLQIYYIMLHKAFPNKKFVMTFHSCYDGRDLGYSNNLKSYLNYCSVSKAMKISDACIYVSEAGKKSWENEFLNSVGKGHVIYNGISQEVLDEGEKRNIQCFNNKPMQFVFVGRLCKGKGISNLIEAIGILGTQYNLNLVIVGDGEEKENLIKLSKTLKLENKINFVGQVLNPEIYLKEADFFVYPSIWQEVFGISLVEAMAMGVFPIANRVGGIPEIITNEKNGILAEETNKESLAIALKTAISTRYNKTYVHICENARETAQQFSILRTVSELERFFKQLMK